MARDRSNRDGLESRPNSGERSPSLWRFAAIGVEFFSPILGGAVLGFYLDRYFHTDPVLAVSGVFLGVVLGFYRLIVELRNFQKSL